MDLVSSLIDIKTAVSLRSRRAAKRAKQSKQIVQKNPIDESYENLQCGIEALEGKDKEYQLIEEYFINTSNGRKLEIIDVFKIDRENEADEYNPDNLGNKKLLWHGSRFSNFVGILSSGLRIAPPEAP